MDINTIKPIFERIRDIPYRIPLTFEERNDACVGKHFLLMDELEKLGFKTRWAECTFDWLNAGVPEEIVNIPHAQPDYHVWLEVLVDDKWETLDATWDIGLKNILPINTWEQFGNIQPAVPVIDMIPYNEIVVTREPPEDYREILEQDRPFLNALNNWLEESREPYA